MSVGVAIGAGVGIRDGFAQAVIDVPVAPNLFSAIHAAMIDSHNSARSIGWTGVGDSTMNNANLNVLSAGGSFQRRKLDYLGITYINAARSGHELRQYVTNAVSPTIDETIAGISGTGADHVVEINLGINDIPDRTKAVVKADLQLAVDTLQAAKPDAMILLVNPIATGNASRNADLLEIYSEVAAENNLPYVSATYTGMLSVYDGTGARVLYYDSTHPSYFGQERVSNIKFNAVVPASLRSVVLMDEEFLAYHSRPTAENLAGELELGYWSSGSGGASGNGDDVRMTEIVVIPEEALYLYNAGGSRWDIKFMNDVTGFVANVTATAVSGEEWRVVVVPEGANRARINISIGNQAFANNIATHPAPYVYYLDPPIAPLTLAEINAGLTLSLGIAANTKSVPAILDVPTLAGAETEGETLTATPAAVSAEPASDRYIQFQRDGVDIDGAEDLTYVLQAADVGSIITVEQREVNSEGEAVAISAATGVIQAVAGPSVPNLSALTVGAQLPNDDLPLGYTIDQNSLTHVVLATTATQPTAVQLHAGQDHTGSAASDAFSATLTTTGSPIEAALSDGLDGSFHVHAVVDGGADGDVITASGGPVAINTVVASSFLFEDGLAGTAGTSINARTGWDPTSSALWTLESDGRGRTPAGGGVSHVKTTDTLAFQSIVMTGVQWSGAADVPCHLLAHVGLSGDESTGYAVGLRHESGVFTGIINGGLYADLVNTTSAVISTITSVDISSDLFDFEAREEDNGDGTSTIRLLVGPAGGTRLEVLTTTQVSSAVGAGGLSTYSGADASRYWSFDHFGLRAA